ncbi:MAG TPA: hypothetical protein VHI93_01390 [Candidatus Thermoplasmatota archaeon]|nr:hypothetical protein [Candidatus Thermoplasmatota archaeon]
MSFPLEFVMGFLTGVALALAGRVLHARRPPRLRRRCAAVFEDLEWSARCVLPASHSGPHHSPADLLQWEDDTDTDAAGGPSA